MAGDSPRKASKVARRTRARTSSEATCPGSSPSWRAATTCTSKRSDTRTSVTVEPIGRDAIFRIASITKPIAGVAAMLLIEDGAMSLDDPVDRWLPELAEPGSYARLESELDDTVPAERPITVEDVLSFHLGYGTSWRCPTRIRSSGPSARWTSRRTQSRGRPPI